jgi:NADH-quinone oxidoreductase subunit C
VADETRVIEAGAWRASLESARDEGFAFFDWLSAVDRTDDEAAPGFDVTAHLLDVGTQGALHGILLVTRVADGASLDSVTGVFAGAAWHERETFEMFGIDFAGYDDGSGLPIRPLLLPDGFEGTPLRKSFQLAARAYKPWPGGKEPGEGHESATSPTRRRRVQAPGVPPPDWGPR